MNNNIKFSICTLVSRLDQYNKLRASLAESGFNNSNSEFLVVDNTESNQMDAYEGIRFFIRNSKNEFLILIHQDVILEQKSYDSICSIINDITIRDPHWAILSNAGKSWNPSKTHVSFGDGKKKWHSQPLPAMVQSVDEHFILLKKSTGVTVSRDLSGFHFYGTELCHLALRLGYTCYVVDFYLTHFSHGNLDDSFYKAKIKIEEKYSNLNKVKIIPTMCAVICTNTGFAYRLLADLYSYYILLHSSLHDNSKELLKYNHKYTHLCSRIIIRLRIVDAIYYLKNKIIRIRADIGWWRINWKSRIVL